MFEVSEKFKNAVRQNTRKYEWYGTITTKAGKEYPFTAKDIVKGSGYINSERFMLGKWESACFRKSTAIPLRMQK